MWCSLMPDTSTLRATLLFADVGEDHLTTIAEAAFERTLRRGDILFTEGAAVRPKHARSNHRR